MLTAIDKTATHHQAELKNNATPGVRSNFTENLSLFAVCLVISFVLMLLITRSSFLYPYNNWDDANSYFSMGKSIFHPGTIIYRDLFDQKGPYLYFLYGLCSLVSRTDFRGVFILEVIWGALDLMAMYAILRLYKVKKATAYVLLPLIMAVMFASRSFYWGGSAEELCMPFLLWPLFWILRDLQTAKRSASETSAAAPAVSAVSVSSRTVLLTGLCCGVVAALKFTLLGFYFAWMLIVLLACIGDSIRVGRNTKNNITADNQSDTAFNSETAFASNSPEKNVRRSWFIRFLYDCGIFLLGMFLAILPWIIYFGINGALDDWYHVYIYTNVFIYSKFKGSAGAGTLPSGEAAQALSGAAALYQKVYSLAFLLYLLILGNIQHFLFIIIGFVYCLVRKGAGLLERFTPVILFGFLFLGIYIGGSELPYYAFPLTAFTVLGFCCIGSIFDASARRIIRSSNSVRISRIAPVLSLIASMAVSLVVIYHYSWNSYYLHYDKEDVFLSAFVQDIEQTKTSDSPTLLNYNCLDCGLYTAADIYPTCYWFQTQTLPIDDVYDEQYRYMREGLTDYIVVRDDYPDLIFEQYEILDSFHQVMGEAEHDYTLFIKK